VDLRRASAREAPLAVTDTPTVPPVENADVLGTAAAGGLVIRGSALRVGGYALNVLVSVLAAPFLIRHLGVAGYGRFVAVTSLAMIVAAVSDAGLNTIGLREYAVRGAAERVLFLRTLLGIRVLLTIAGLALVAVVLGAAGSERLPVAGFALVGAGLVLTVIQHTYTIPLTAHLRLGTVTALDLARSLATTGLVLAFVAAGLGLNAFFGLSIPVGVIVLTLTVALVRKSVPLLPQFRIRETWTLLRDTLAFAAASALGFVYYRIAIVVLALISTQRETGFFSASFRVVETLTVVPVLLVSTAFPVLARAAHDDHRRFGYALQGLFDVSLIVGAWFALTTAIAAEPAIRLIAGGHFSPSISVLQIQAASLLATFLAGASGYALLAQRRHAVLVGVNGIALMLAVVLTVALAHSHGADGAAIAVTAAEFVLAGLQWWGLVRRRRSLRPSLRRVSPVLLAAAAAGACAFVPGLPDLAAAAVASIVYLAVLLLFRAIPQELIDELRPKRVAAP
jgi:O-antigen/teichoic acid export membrane protein